MVEPEIVHHLLQLPVAVDGARDFGHGQFFHDALRALAVVGDGARHRVGIDAKRAALRRSRRGGVCRRLASWAKEHRLWPLHFRAEIGLGLLLRVARNDACCCVGTRLLLLLLLVFLGVRPACLAACFGCGYSAMSLSALRCRVGSALKAGIDDFVVDGIGIELLLNPLCQAHLLDPFEIAGSRTVGKTIQGMQNRLVNSELGDRQAFQNGILLFFLFRCSRVCNGSGECDVQARGKKKREREKRRQCRTESGHTERRPIEIRLAACFMTSPRMEDLSDRIRAPNGTTAPRGPFRITPRRRRSCPEESRQVSKTCQMAGRQACNEPIAGRGSRPARSLR